MSDRVENKADNISEQKYAICRTRWLRNGGTQTKWFTGEIVGHTPIFSHPDSRITMDYQDAMDELSSGLWPDDVQALPVP